MSNVELTQQNIQGQIDKLFKDFPQDSQVWIYQANRCLSFLESKHILDKATKYAHSWTAHGQPISADAAVLFDHFLVFAVDDRSKASGCSIDSSVGFVKHLEQEFEVSFFDRMQIVIGKDDVLEQFHANEIKLGLQTKEIDSSFSFFDNSVSTLKDLKSKWYKELAGSWLAPSL